MASKEKVFLPGPKQPLWGCSGCGMDGNWANRTTCRGCGKSAPWKVVAAAKAAAAANVAAAARAAEDARTLQSGRAPAAWYMTALEHTLRALAVRVRAPGLESEHDFDKHGPIISTQMCKLLVALLHAALLASAVLRAGSKPALRGGRLGE